MGANERRLAAIMFTDMVGYTASTQSDESRSLALLEKHNQMIRPLFQKYHGREIKTMGDSFLVEFESALDATSCAIEIQRLLHDFNQSTPGDWRISLRIGIHLGDVVHSEGDVFGDAVNIASRIRPLSEPGGACVTGEVYNQVQNKLSQRFLKLEPAELKGVKTPVEVYRLVMPWSKESYNVPPPGPALVDRNRLAILPFTNMSPDPADEYFADGMTEELIDRLAQIKKLKVIARTSVMRYRGSQKSVAEVAKELGTGALVEGSVRKAGNRVRVAVQLIDGRTEEHIWSSHYDGTLDDIFAVQSEIAEKVAKELKIQLAESDRDVIEKKPTENTAAYSAFLHARELYRESSDSSVREALALYEKAVELDPTFARAYVGMADCWLSLPYQGEPVSGALQNARRSIARALELDPELAEAHAALSNLLFNEDDLPGAERAALKAIELNPSLPEPYRQLFEIAAMKGQPGQMVRFMETVYRLDPANPLYVYLLGQVYIWTGRETDALELWKRTEAISPAFTYRGLADYYLGKGDIAKAKEYHSKVEKLITHSWVTYAGGMIAARAGDKEKAALTIRKLEEEAKTSAVAFNYIAYVYLSLDDLDSYFEWMEKAVDHHAQIQSTMMFSPLLAKSRADPRFGALLEKVRRQTKVSVGSPDIEVRT